MPQAQSATAGKPKTIPPHRALPPLIRDPLRALVDFGDQAGGEVVRLGLGSFRPYLVTHPDHVQRVLRDNAAAYARSGDGLFWGPLGRLFGEGILSDGQVWEASRSTLQPLFTAKRIGQIFDDMGTAIHEAVDTMGRRPGPDARLDVGNEIAGIVCTGIMRTLFGDRISVPNALRIVAAQDRIATAMLVRMLVPFAPNWLPMPGDRAFRRSVQTIDDILVPVVRATRQHPGDGDDVISALCRAQAEAERDEELPPGKVRTSGEEGIRGDAVAMVAASTETTIGVLTWLWPILDAHPAVASRLQEEIDQVVGAGPVQQSHLGQLRYLRMVLDEMVRLYPVGWLIPRMTTTADVLGGVRIERGATILISPYITQRMATFWESPDDFDPERFAPDRPARPHRYAYFPFGGGGHQCLGQHLFYLEAQLIVATVLSRFRFTVHNRSVPPIKVGAALRPRGRVEMTLRPANRAA